MRGRGVKLHLRLLCYNIAYKQKGHKLKKQYYIGDGVFNTRSNANQGYIHKVGTKKERKILKKRGYLFFETYEMASNYRLADIMGG